MLQEIDHFEIPVQFDNELVRLIIYPQSDKFKMFEDDNPLDETMRYHLTEGGIYDYEFVSRDDSVYQFFPESEIIKIRKSERHKSEGIISTGIYVGHLRLQVVKNGKPVSFNVDFEIRSVKTDYESDYRQMLEDIAEYYTDLVLQQGAPVTQRLEVDEKLSPNTLYQRFAFVQSIIQSQNFAQAIHKIISNPVRKWKSSNKQQKIVSVRRFSKSNVKQIASSQDRVALFGTNSLYPHCLTSVPRYIDVECKQDTVDVVENQFVKFVLRTFYMFCSDIKEMKNASNRLKVEAEQIVTQIGEYLDCQFFRQISLPSFINMNSPVLQRKEGYREVFQDWLLFDLAAKLNWSGGDDVYGASKKNVATLYEYWLFFKLLELVCNVFGVVLENKEKLVTSSKNGDVLNLDLKQGRMRMIYGRNASTSRILNVALYYNRTFNRIVDLESDKRIHKAGSWTMSMRPDYTLSLWPGDISESKAEMEDMITHIHFDAKYRLDHISFEDNSNQEEQILEELNLEKEQQEIGIYKRADILKMHAYKDAIRRTCGAYVLYPGTENKIEKGFHEIIPGLGAFSVRPGHWNEDSCSLKNFLLEIKKHFMNRISQRERMSYYQFETYKHEPGTPFIESVPESVGSDRDFIPDKTTVLVANIKSLNIFKWMCDKHLYALCLGEDANLVSMSEYLNARYILFHEDKDIYGLVRIKTAVGDKRSIPYICSRTELIKKGWPYNPNFSSLYADNVYLLFEIDPNMGCEKELNHYSWNLDDILPNPYMLQNTFPINLVDLINKSR